MKLHFEPDLDYQKLAIEAVADLFGIDLDGFDVGVLDRHEDDRGLDVAVVGAGRRRDHLDEEFEHDPGDQTLGRRDRRVDSDGQGLRGGALGDCPGHRHQAAVDAASTSKPRRSSWAIARMSQR